MHNWFEYLFVMFVIHVNGKINMTVCLV